MVKIGPQDKFSRWEIINPSNNMELFQFFLCHRWLDPAEMMANMQGGPPCSTSLQALDLRDLMISPEWNGFVHLGENKPYDRINKGYGKALKLVEEGVKPSSLVLDFTNSRNGSIIAYNKVEFSINMTVCLTLHEVRYNAVINRKKQVVTLISLVKVSDPGWVIDIQGEVLTLRMSDSNYGPVFQSKLDTWRKTDICVVMSEKFVDIYFDGVKRVNECQPLKHRDCLNATTWRRPIYGNASLVLGQKQNEVAGDFEPSQSFAGKFSNLAIWNEALSAEDALRWHQMNGTIDLDAVFNMSSLIQASTFWTGDINVEEGT